VPEGNVSFGTSRRRFDIRLRRDPVGEIASLFDDSALVVLDLFIYETDRKPRWSSARVSDACLVIKQRYPVVRTPLPLFQMK
jgi:hypothetical protein